jgi:hypothetical protein
MRSADHGWTSALVVVPVGAGLLLLIVFAVAEARLVARPLLPPRLFRARGVVVGNGMLLLFGGFAIAMWYFTSLFLQNVLGYSALASGLGQTPAAVTFVVVARVAAGLLPRTGVLGPTLLVAVGIGLAFPTLMAAATADVPEGDAGIVGGLANTTGQVGGSVGLAVLATAAGARTATGGPTPAAALAAGCDLVFLIAAGLGLAIAVVSPLLPRKERAVRRG